MKKRIMIVDDEDTILASISSFIRLEMNHEPVTHSSPVNAIAMLERENVDLIISDFLMPELDGIQFLKRAQEICPEVPRILLTGYADKENAIRAINIAGIYYYLEKPWDNDELMLIIKNGLEKRDLVSQLRLKVKELEKTRDALIYAERMSAIGRVTSQITHDLRTPLTIIRGNADMLTWDNVSEEKKINMINAINNQADKISGLIDDILHFAKGDWKIDIRPGKVTRKELMDKIITPLTRIAEKYQVLIAHSIRFTGALTMDQNAFYRVFDNFFRNSLDVLKPGGRIKIKISEKKSENAVYLVFSDDGPGIPDKIIKDLFEPFVSYNKSRGIGLGLSICREIVQKHGGTISVKNDPGGGAVFTIKLPHGDK